MVSPLRVEIPEGSPLSMREGTYDLIELRSLGKRIEEAPLHQRGWVFQEHMLSPRVLHFLNGRISRECEQGTAPEGYQNDQELLQKLTAISWRFFRNCSFNWRKLQMHGGDDHERLSKPCTPECGFCRTWSTIIYEYSRCDFTLTDDRPWALTGLAAEIERLSGDEYLAGLWKGHLHLQLLWLPSSVLDRHPTQELQARPRRACPSFSPLSVDTPVLIPALNRRILFSVIDAQRLSVSDLTKTSSGVTFQPGWLQIRAVLKAVRIVNTSFMEQDLGYLMRPEASATTYKRLKTLSLSLDPALNDEETSSSSPEYFLMHAAQTPDPAFKWDHWILLEVVDQVARTFRRLGIVDSCFNEARDDAREDHRLMQEDHYLDQKAPGRLDAESGDCVFYLV